MKFYSVIAFLFIFFFVSPYVNYVISDKYGHASDAYNVKLNRPFDKKFIVLRLAQEIEDVKNEKDGFDTILAYAEAGYTGAMVNLSELYERGLGVEKNLVEASIWLWRAQMAVKYQPCKGGQCNQLQDEYNQMEIKISKLDSKLTSEQKNQLNTLKEQRYPDLVSINNWSDFSILINLFCFIGLLFILFK